jgi:ammonia channel protein AmtB
MTKLETAHDTLREIFMHAGQFRVREQLRVILKTFLNYNASLCIWVRNSYVICLSDIDNKVVILTLWTF